jgi:hypothetical protein
VRLIKTDEAVKALMSERCRKMYVFFMLGIFSLVAFTSYADHIVGGNLEMIARDNIPGRYTMRLIIFQDEEFGVAGVEPSSQGFMIYRTRDNQKMKFVIAEIANYGEGNVVYFNDSCSQNRKLKTRKLIYEEEVNLDPALYDDPAGYYVVWADGYRDAGLNNITRPDVTGITLQLKFPPLKRSGQPFLNSSRRGFQKLLEPALISLQVILLCRFVQERRKD